MINVSLAEIVPEGVLAVMSDGLVETVLDDMANVGRAKWIRAAQQGLKTSTADYIRSIGEIESETGIRTISLVGWLANAIENGLDPYDLRKTLLGPGARNRKEAKGGGFYNTVPFRHGTPGTTSMSSIGSAYGSSRGGSRAAFGTLTNTQAAQFGKELYQSAKRLKAKQQWASTGRSGGAMQTGSKKGTTLKESAVGAAYRGAGGRTESLLLQPHHKSSIYAGMRKERKPYFNPQTQKTTVQSQYITFRRISTNVAVGWRHPGIEAHRFSDQVADHIAKIAPKLIQTAIGKAARP